MQQPPQESQGWPLLAALAPAMPLAANTAALLNAQAESRRSSPASRTTCPPTFHPLHATPCRSRAYLEPGQLLLPGCQLPTQLARAGRRLLRLLSQLVGCGGGAQPLCVQLVLQLRQRGQGVVGGIGSAQQPCELFVNGCAPWVAGQSMLKDAAQAVGWLGHAAAHRADLADPPRQRRHLSSLGIQLALRLALRLRRAVGGVACAGVSEWKWGKEGAPSFALRSQLQGGSARRAAGTGRRCTRPPPGPACCPSPAACHPPWLPGAPPAAARAPHGACSRARSPAGRQGCWAGLRHRSCLHSAKPSKLEQGSMGEVVGHITAARVGLATQPTPSDATHWPPPAQPAPQAASSSCRRRSYCNACCCSSSFSRSPASSSAWDAA